MVRLVGGADNPRESPNPLGLNPSDGVSLTAPDQRLKIAALAEGLSAMETP